MITSLDQVTEFPLCWPDGKPRAAERRRSQFQTTIAKAHREISHEMSLWGARGHIVSMAPAYRQGRVDPGVALWWAMPRRNAAADLRVLACDTFETREDNLHAIALTLTGLRAFERYGTYTREQAVEGARPALPPPVSKEYPWWDVLGVERNWPLGAIEAVWKTKIEKAHPDRGGDPALMRELNVAMQAAREAQKNG